MDLATDGFQSHGSILPKFHAEMSRGRRRHICRLARLLAIALQGSAFVGIASLPRRFAPRGAVLGITSDESVPEEHRGLHGALYGQDAEAIHAASSGAEELLQSWPGRLDGTELLHLETWLEAISALIVPDEAPRPAIGLFAVYDSSEAEAPRRVGYSRRVQGDLSRLRSQHSHVRVRLLGSEPKMWTRQRLEDMSRDWAQELGIRAEALDEVLGKCGAADKRGGEAEAILDEERMAFDERKWKMQLAMGQNIADAQSGEEESNAERRRKFLRAMEGDDWSAAISEQSKATKSTKPVMTSPFTMRSRGGIEEVAVGRDLTVANVAAVLAPLRPVLQADGGDLEVLGVNLERGAVLLGLKGACTTCPAAPDTMEDGIERALREHFGKDVVREVIRVDKGAAETTEEAVRDRVMAHLLSLKEALDSEGARARLLRQDAGVSEPERRAPLVVEVQGSEMLFQLVQSSLTYRFPELAGRLRVEKASSGVAVRAAMHV